MNALKENAGSLIALIAAVNVSLSLIYNYFYFGSFDLTLDMLPATYSDYLMSSLDILSSLFLYGLFIAVAMPVFVYFDNHFHHKAGSNYGVIHDGALNPLFLLFKVVNTKAYSALLALNVITVLGASLIVYIDAGINLYYVKLIKVAGFSIFLFLVINPVLYHYYGKLYSLIFNAIFVAVFFAAFAGSVNGHNIRFATHIPHLVKSNICNNCVIVKSLSDTYILWDYSGNRILMLNKQEHDFFVIELMKKN